MTLYIRVYDKLASRPIGKYNDMLYDSEYDEDDDEQNFEMSSLFKKDEIDS